MNKYKNIIIYGELDYILSANFEGVKDKARVLEYTSKSLPFDRNDNGATNMNALYVLNNTLEQLLELKNEKNGVLNETSYITIPDKLYKSIQKGTYKNWIKNDGKATSGLIYPKKEIEEWSRFTSLYSHLFLDINFRNMTYYAMSNPRYDIDNVNKHKYLIKQMKEQVEKHKNNSFDEILNAF